MYIFIRKLMIILLVNFGFNAFGQIVNIPDPNFKAYLVGNTDINTNGDSEIQVSEAEAFTGEIDCSSKNIVDLTGIEAFVNLISLDCGYNQLTTIDVSKNTALTGLYCYENQLTTLDMSKNTALIDLTCWGNQLTTLDLGKNTALTSLVCYYNHLTTLNVSKNTALIHLDCAYNQLTALDVSKNTALTGLYCYENQLTTLDMSKNTALIDLTCWGNQLTTLDLSKNTALTELECYNNQLTTIDVSKNLALVELNCRTNQLNSLDVSKNTALGFLLCSDNQLINLDVSKNIKMKIFGCHRNQLTSLNAKNGNNSNMGQFSIKDNPSLTCVTVDDTTYSNANWLNKDPQTKYSLDCEAISATDEITHDANVIQLYPNPADDILYIKLPGSLSDATADIQIFDIYGKEALRYTTQSQPITSIDVSTLKSGVYLAKVANKDDKGIRIMRFIKN